MPDRRRRTALHLPPPAGPVPAAAGTPVPSTGSSGPSARTTPRGRSGSRVRPDPRHPGAPAERQSVRAPARRRPDRTVAATPAGARRFARQRLRLRLRPRQAVLGQSVEQPPAGPLHAGGFGGRPERPEPAEQRRPAGTAAKDGLPTAAAADCAGTRRTRPSAAPVTRCSPGMWAFFFALFDFPEIALLLGALALYWASAHCAPKQPSGPHRRRPAAATRPRALREVPRAAAAPTGGRARPLRPRGSPARPQITAAVSGLVTASLALLIVAAATFTVQLVYRDYYTCVNDSLTKTGQLSCNDELPDSLVPGLRRQGVAGGRRTSLPVPRSSVARGLSRRARAKGRERGRLCRRPRRRAGIRTVSVGSLRCRSRSVPAGPRRTAAAGKSAIRPPDASLQGRPADARRRGPSCHAAVGRKPHGPVVRIRLRWLPGPSPSRPRPSVRLGRSRRRQGFQDPDGNSVRQSYGLAPSSVVMSPRSLQRQSHRRPRRTDRGVPATAAAGLTGDAVGPHGRRAPVQPPGP